MLQPQPSPHARGGIAAQPSWVGRGPAVNSQQVLHPVLTHGHACLLLVPVQSNLRAASRLPPWPFEATNS